MPPIDVSGVLVQIATAEAGPYATIQDVQSYGATHGTEDAARVRVFGKATPYLRAGDDVDDYDLSGLYNPDDTGGQNILRTARDNRTTVWLRIMPTGDTSGDKGYKQQCNVTEYSDSGDADGDYVECSFTLEGVGPKIAVTIV